MAEWWTLYGEVVGSVCEDGRSEATREQPRASGAQGVCAARVCCLQQTHPKLAVADDWLKSRALDDGDLARRDAGAVDVKLLVVLRRQRDMSLIEFQATQFYQRLVRVNWSSDTIQMMALWPSLTTH